MLCSGRVIQIAGKLDIVIAEGIETEDQGLLSVGCSLGEGYLFSEAVDCEATTALLLRGTKEPSGSRGHKVGHMTSSPLRIFR